MQDSLIQLLRDPASGENLEVVAFTRASHIPGDERIVEGVLYAPQSGAAFPIIDGVPILLPSAFPPAFLEKHRSILSELAKCFHLRLDVTMGDDFSFSAQWGTYSESDSARMWGWTVDERIDQLVMELQVDRHWFRGKTLVDAGCGPGDLTQGIAALGAHVVGFDYSSAVFEAERRRRFSSVQFVRGDARAIGLKREQFDAAVSMGLFMFTPAPRECFTQVCGLVKPGGRFYVCVDRPSETLFGRYVRYPALDAARRIVSRLPAAPRSAAVKMWAGAVYGLHRTLGKNRVSYRDYLVSAYNEMAPRWHRVFTAYEIAGWLHENGFSAPTLSHWDNPYAFGLVAVKTRQERTPGIHFGRGPKLWDREGMTT